MAIIYKSCTIDGETPRHVCEPCNKTESGRVRGVSMLNKSVLKEATDDNLQSIDWWETQIAAKSALFIPNVRGTYDGGEVNTTDGFGDEAERRTDKTHTLTFSDGSHTGNDGFYEYLEDNYRNYVAVWRTGSELRIGSRPLTSLTVSDPAEDDLDSTVVFEVTATWRQKKPSIVRIIDISENDEVLDLFTNCIDMDALTSRSQQAIQPAKASKKVSE